MRTLRVVVVIVSGWWCAGKSHALETLAVGAPFPCRVLDVAKCVLETEAQGGRACAGERKGASRWDPAEKLRDAGRLAAWYRYGERAMRSVMLDYFDGVQEPHVLVVEAPPPFLGWWSFARGRLWLEVPDSIRRERLLERLGDWRGLAGRLEGLQKEALWLEGVGLAGVTVVRSGAVIRRECRKLWEEAGE